MRNRDYALAHSGAGKLDITIQTKTADTELKVTAARLDVSMGVFTFTGDGAGMNASSLISSDVPNDLKLGSDNKLLAEPNKNPTTIQSWIDAFNSNLM